MNNIYQPEEDSFLLSETLRKLISQNLDSYKNLKFLEIGSGSGIQLETLNNLSIPKNSILACDINKDAVKFCKKIGFNCIYSDLFKNVKGKFDIIIFNPPYLPESKYDKKADTTGGRRGGEIINEFLRQSKKHLTLNGKIILLTSNFTGGIHNYGFKKRKIAEKSLFFEKLFVWEIKR